MCPTVPGDRHWRIWPQISAARLAIPSPVELARGYGAGIGRDTNQYAKSAAADVERAHITADAAKIAERAVDKSWSEIRALVREALLLLILLAVVVLGLPFAAGYFLGRHRAAGNRNRGDP